MGPCGNWGALLVADQAMSKQPVPVCRLQHKRCPMAMEGIVCKKQLISFWLFEIWIASLSRQLCHAAVSCKFTGEMKITAVTALPRNNDTQ